MPAFEICKKALYAHDSQAVAIVAAEEPEQARRAAAAVRVEYEPLEPVTDPERATEMEPLHLVAELP